MSHEARSEPDRVEPGKPRQSYPPEAHEAGPSAPRQPFLYLHRLTIVVFGILIAFALESWWAGRREETEALTNLIALREDFRQNLTRLDSVARVLGTVRAAGGELMRIVQGESAAPGADSLSSLVAETFRLAGFQPVTAAYDNLINARDLGQLRNHELRLALATFVTQLGWVREVERWQNDQWILVNQPFLNSWIEVSDLVPYWTDDSTRATLPHPRHGTDWQAALEARTFRNIVIQRVIAADDILRTQGALRHQVEVILTLLEDAIGES